MSSMMMNMNNVDHSSLPIFVFFFRGTFFSPPVFPVFGFFLFFSSFAVVRFFFLLESIWGLLASACCACRIEYDQVLCTPGCASLEIRTPHPEHPPSAESTQNPHTPRHPRTGHPIAFGFGLGFGFGSGGLRQAPRPKSPDIYMYLVLYTWYQVFRYSSNVVVHFIVGAFRTRTPEV